MNCELRTFNQTCLSPYEFKKQKKTKNKKQKTILNIRSYHSNCLYDYVCLSPPQHVVVIGLHLHIRQLQSQLSLARSHRK